MKRTSLPLLARRQFLMLVGGAAAWPLAARAQQRDQVWRIGILLGGVEDDPQSLVYLTALKKALQELGWAEGRNIHFEYRWGAADAARAEVVVKEMIGLRPNIILAANTPVVIALKRETKTIPIVFVSVSDPVGSGLVESLPRPGGNITGFINIEGSLSGKWIELLKDIAPRTRRAALLFNPDTATYADYYLQPFEAAARSSSIEPIAAVIRSAADIERIFATINDRADAGLALMPDIALVTYRDLIISLAARYRVPTIYPFPYYVPAGGLISYGIDTTDLYRRAATYIDRVLKGAKPADLPVQQPTKFELGINLKTAGTLGLAVPAILQATADEVIE